MLQFLNNPYAYYKESSENISSPLNFPIKGNNYFFQAEKKSALNKQLGHNNNFWDLGFSNEMTDEANINSAVAEILQKFDLIMISDYMDQSLILLKDELGWNIEDILYFTINKRFDFSSFFGFGSSRTTVTDRFHPTISDSRYDIYNSNDFFRSNDSKPVLSNELKTKIRSWNLADSMLFDAVNSTFWAKIEKFGFDKMEMEVKSLRKLIDERMEFCVAEISVLTKEEQLKQCPLCKTVSSMQKYVLTEQGRALSQKLCLA